MAKQSKTRGRIAYRLAWIAARIVAKYADDDKTVEWATAAGEISDIYCPGVWAHAQEAAAIPTAERAPYHKRHARRLEAERRLNAYLDRIDRDWSEHVARQEAAFWESYDDQADQDSYADWAANTGHDVDYY